MSETLLKILIDELCTLRIVCDRCGTVLELPIDKLDGGGQVMDLFCPCKCGPAYRIPSTHRSDAFAKLADAVRELKHLGQSHGCKIEFIFPEKPAAKP